MITSIEATIAAAQPAAPDGTRWLFPGRASVRPLTALAVTRQLNHYGIHLRAGRTAALVGRAGQLPPAVLASLLGLHPATAAVAGYCWSEVAVDWASAAVTAALEQIRRADAHWPRFRFLSHDVIDVFRVQRDRLGRPAFHGQRHEREFGGAEDLDVGSGVENEQGFFQARTRELPVPADFCTPGAGHRCWPWAGFNEFQASQHVGQTSSPSPAPGSASTIRSGTSRPPGYSRTAQPFGHGSPRCTV